MFAPIWEGIEERVMLAWTSYSTWSNAIWWGGVVVERDAMKSYLDNDMRTSWLRASLNAIICEMRVKGWGVDYTFIRNNVW